MRGLLLIVMLWIGASAQAAQPPALAGVWDGTIGGLPVRACFNQRDWGTFGGYYYRLRLETIPLQLPDGETRTFVEGHSEKDNKAPRWTFETIGADRLSGSWKQAGRTLPIRLTRVSTAGLGEDETPCGSMTFHKPRFTGIKIVTKAARFEGGPYTRLILDHRGHFGDSVTVETFALPGTSQAIRRINAKLREPLAEGADDWRSCILWAWNVSPHGGEFSQVIVPTTMTRRWLSAKDSSGNYCGGAHPNYGEYPLTFDLASGEAVDLHDWFDDKAMVRERHGAAREVSTTISAAFRTHLLASWKADDSECREVVREAEHWTIALTRTAFLFSPSLPHVAQACAEEFPLPFAKAAPYLNAEGRKNLAALRSEP
jgi:hypothetical protein